MLVPRLKFEPSTEWILRTSDKRKRCFLSTVNNKKEHMGSILSNKFYRKVLIRINPILASNLLRCCISFELSPKPVDVAAFWRSASKLFALFECFEHIWWNLEKPDKIGLFRPASIMNVKAKNRHSSTEECRFYLLPIHSSLFPKNTCRFLESNK